MTAREIVETALGLRRTGYVFPDLAEPAAAAIEVRLAAGEYQGMDEAALADLLTSQQLNDICADKHLRVRTMPPRAARPEPGEPAGQRPAPRERRRPPHDYGIYRVERLEGNVGYLDLRGVADPEDAGSNRSSSSPARRSACSRDRSTTRFLPVALIAARSVLVLLRDRCSGARHDLARWDPRPAATVAPETG